MDSSLSIRDFFTRHFTPVFLAGGKARTIEEYSITVKKWTGIFGDVALCDLTVVMLARFRDELVAGTGKASGTRLSPATVNKHLRHLNHIIGKAGPPGPRNRDALGILNSTPWVKSLKVLRCRPHTVDFSLLGEAYRAARFARLPKVEGCEGCEGREGYEGYEGGEGYRQNWWRALYVTAYTTAFRRGALFSLVWDDVDVAAAIVGLPAEFDKCGVERVKPLHRAAIAHLLKIRLPGRRKLFEWRHGWKAFYKEWHTIQDMAGIETKDHFTLHDLKRTAGTELSDVASPWVVQQMLDHASINTSRHYVNVARKLRPAVDRMSMPECFLEN